MVVISLFAAYSGRVHPAAYMRTVAAVTASLQSTGGGRPSLETVGAKALNRKVRMWVLKSDVLSFT